MRAIDSQLRPSVGVLILAAGASTRMGQPKMLLPWNGTTIISHLVEVWNSLGATQVGIVCAKDDQRLRAELDRVSVPLENRILNPAPERGMFSSIQCASAWAGWQRTISDFVIVLGDQPHLRRQTLQLLLDFKSRNSDRICQPSYKGRLRHPVILPRTIFLELASFNGTNLKNFLQSQAEKAVSVSIEDPGLELDLDRPEDFKLAVETYSKTYGD